VSKTKTKKNYFGIWWEQNQQWLHLHKVSTFKVFLLCEIGGILDLCGGLSRNVFSEMSVVTYIVVNVNLVLNNVLRNKFERNVTSRLVWTGFLAAFDNLFVEVILVTHIFLFWNRFLLFVWVFQGSWRNYERISHSRNTFISTLL